MLVGRKSGRRQFVRTLLATIGLFASSVLVTPNVRAADALKPDADGYIRDWVMLAPIALPAGRPAGDLIVEEQVKNEAALQPKAGDTVKVNGKELTWQNITASTKYFDFNAILKTDQRPRGWLHGHLHRVRQGNERCNDGAGQ